ncbi:hypothetical protein TrRE_jg982 [Triparma retinervis]|uniref:Uncharacterized protein n=1 Tax=Triparma retinervis TaxID=2557542 RepID=A0A9W6ZUZ0_9STRA|nr:hypothetical protein TrRE_jg982 [Triparma retinervis]
MEKRIFNGTIKQLLADMSSSHEGEHVELLKFSGDDGRDSDSDTDTMSSGGQEEAVNRATRADYEFEGKSYNEQEVEDLGAVKELVEMFRYHYKGMVGVAIVAFVSIFLGVVWATSASGNIMDPDAIKVNRYIPDALEQRGLSMIYRTAISEIDTNEVFEFEGGGGGGSVRRKLEEGEGGVGLVSIQGLYKGGIRGHDKLPDCFYEGFHVGLSSYDVEGFISSYVVSKESDFADPKRGQAFEDLMDILKEEITGGDSFLAPQKVYPWKVMVGNSTLASGDVEITQGVVLAYGFDYMASNMLMTTRLTKDKTMTVRDYSRVTDMVESVGRKMGALTVHMWYPNQFAAGQESIIQEVRPIRTGLQQLKSTGAVWKRENRVEDGGE